jgi:FtsH-binding integral membrane protein
MGLVDDILFWIGKEIAEFAIGCIIVLAFAALILYLERRK